VQAQQKRVESGIVAGGRGDPVDLGETPIWDRSASRGQPARLGDFPRWVVRLTDQPIVLRVPIHTAQRGDQVLGRAPPTASVPSRHNVRLGVFL
jgi:hypothetical protein